MQPGGWGDAGWWNYGWGARPADEGWQQAGSDAAGGWAGGSTQRGWEGHQAEQMEAPPASPDPVDEGPWSWWWSFRSQAWMHSPQVLRSRRGRWAWDDDRTHGLYFLPPQ